MNPRSWLAVGLAVALSACGGGKQAPPPSIPAEQAKVDAIFAEYARPGSPGVAVGIYRGGKQIYSAGYGYADLASNVAITPHTPFQIASTSKQFAAFSAVLLERDGKLDLDADLRDYLPYVPDFGRKITPRHLIYHTSGLRDQWDLFLLGGRSMSDRLRQSQIVTMVTRQRGLNFAPGAGFEYSNTGYTLLAELVGAVSGQTLREFSDTRIFRPLGMRDTFFSDDLSEIIPNRAHSYEQRDGKWHLAPLNYETVGATGLYATVEDLLRWAANFTRPVVGDTALIREFSEMGKLDDGSAIPYGFGLKRMTFSGHEAIYHNGSDAAFRSQFAYFPEQDFAVVLLANNGMNLQPAFEKVIAAYLPAATTQNSLPALTTPEPSLVDALQGTYLTPGGSTVLLSKGAHGLVLQSKQRDRTLNFWADGVFDVEDQRRAAGTFFRPVLDSDGAVSAIDLVEADAVVRYPRFVKRASTALDLTELAGTYRSAELDTIYHVDAQADGLSIDSLWLEQPVKLMPTAADRFEGAYPFDKIAVQRDKQGRPVALLVSTVRMIDLRLDRLR